MALGDGIRRNIAFVDPVERDLLRSAFMKMNTPKWNGNRDDPVTVDGVSHTVPGGVTWWFKQDEIHTVTHVHHGPEFLPWHRLLINWFEDLLRVIDPQLSLHYWDWTQDPRKIPNANLGGGHTGDLRLFEDLGSGVEGLGSGVEGPAFMGYGGPAPQQPIGPDWEAAGFYNPHAGEPGFPPARTGPFSTNYNAADPPKFVTRSVGSDSHGHPLVPATRDEENAVIAADDYLTMSGQPHPDGSISGLEGIHDAMHTFVDMGGRHISFRDPFVFLLHSNVDRLFAVWQNRDPDHRLRPDQVYGTASALLNGNIEPWSTGVSTESELGPDHPRTHLIRPWFKPDSLAVPIPYKDLSVVLPRPYEHPPEQQPPAHPA